MCLECRMTLPVLQTHLDPRENELVCKLQSRIPLEGAVAYFRYRREESHAQLLHDAKYRGRPSIGRQLAAEFAAIVEPRGFFDGVDAIVPVPLNVLKHAARGYNQTYHIARGIADVHPLPVIDALSARRHKSQTARGAEARRQAVGGIYSARPGALDGVGHVVLVDDIATTGSTIYECLSALHGAWPSLRLSVFVLASTARSL